MSNNMLVDDLLACLGPALVHSGSYARNVQQQIKAQPDKSYDNPFAVALTDADLSIQNFIEVTLLANFPELRFWGEEFEHSLNMKYFSSESEICVYLDPIDGTRFFKDKLEQFSVILTVANKSEILAVAVHLPTRGRLYLARKNGGVTVQTDAQALKNLPGEQFRFLPQTKTLLGFGALAIQLRAGGCTVVDMNAEYDPAQGCMSVLDLFAGSCAGLVAQNAGLIDWGALAFLIKEAGGVCCDFRGNELPPINQIGEAGSYLRYPQMVAVSDEQLRRQVVASLAR